MKRLNELIQKVIIAGKEDDFLQKMKSSLKYPSWMSTYDPYEQALQCLDQSAWNILSAKAIEHYTQHRKGQLKEAFFNQLNEAFAYQYLVNQGYENVQFLVDTAKKRKTPDLSYKIDNNQFYCEVKSIGVSVDELNRNKSGESYDGSVYYSLSKGFFNKLQSNFSKSTLQISKNGEGMIFIFIPRFDDHTFMYYPRYKEQIIDFLISNEVYEVYFKIGFNEEFIYKKRNGEIEFS